MFSTRAAAADNTDSLRAALGRHPKADTARVRLLSLLFEKYINNNIDSAKELANEGLAESQQINYERGQEAGYRELGIASLDKNEYEEALSYFNKAFSIAQREKNKPAMALILCYKGNVYTHQASNGEAIEYLEKSLELCKTINDHQTEALALVSMGSVYSELGDFTTSLKYYLNALMVVEKANDTLMLTTCLSNISGTYSALGDFKKSLEYNNQTLQLSLRQGNKTGVLAAISNAGETYGRMGDYRKSLETLYRGVALADSIGSKYFKNICLANIGEAYYSMGSYDTAYEKYEAALREAKVPDDAIETAQCENGIGSILVKRGKVREGITHLLTSLRIVQETGLKGPAEEIAGNLSAAYEKINDLPEALKYYKIYSAYMDSLYNEKSDKRIQKLQFDYELGKKENEIILLEKDKAIEAGKSLKQSEILGLSVAGLVFLIVVILLLYRSRAYEKRSKEEIYRQKEEIQMQATRLEELNRFKDKTFSVISHDLKKPIDTFSSLISMLDGKLITPEEYLSLKPEISAQVSSLSLLLDNLLKWGSGYMKGKTARPEAVNLHLLAQQNIGLFLTAANKKEITVANHVPPTMMALCDPEQLDIVIRNLTVNAIKFSHHKGLVTLSAESDPDHVYFSVTDQGVGMSKEQMDKLFTIGPGNHTYGTDGETGTGLGLLLCNEFIKANGGSISVSSEQGKGSTFTVTLKKAV